MTDIIQHLQAGNTGLIFIRCRLTKFDAIDCDPVHEQRSGVTNEICRKVKKEPAMRNWLWLWTGETWRRCRVDPSGQRKME